MLPSVTVLKAIGIYIISFLAGFAFYYFTNQKGKAEKRKMIDQFLSLIINFIIYIWLGKIIVHILLVFKDPLAVLAYPSDSKVLFVATILFAGHLVYFLFKRKKEMLEQLRAAFPMMLA